MQLNTLSDYSDTSGLVLWYCLFSSCWFDLYSHQKRSKMIMCLDIQVVILWPLLSVSPPLWAAGSSSVFLQVLCRFPSFLYYVTPCVFLLQGKQCPTLLEVFSKWLRSIRLYEPQHLRKGVVCVFMDVWEVTLYLYKVRILYIRI